MAKFFVILMASVAMSLIGCGDSAPQSTNDTIEAGELLAGDIQLLHGFTDRPIPTTLSIIQADITQRITYQQEYLDALNKKAEAALIDARAREQRGQVVNAQIRSAMFAMETNLRQIKQKQANLTRQKAAIATTARTYSRLSSGETSPQTLHALNFFYVQSGLSDEHRNTMQVPALSADNFLPRLRHREAVDFQGGSLPAYLEFLQANSLNVKPGMEGQRPITFLTDAIGDTAAAMIDQRENQRSRLDAEIQAEWEKTIELIEKLEALNKTE